MLESFMSSRETSFLWSIVFFLEKISADGMDLAVIAVFYTDSRICPVSADRAGFS